MLEILGFYFFGALSLGFLAVSVFSRDILYALSSLAAGLIFISGIFFILGAEFLGVVQIMVYSGAVMMIYMFSMMFFDVSKLVVQEKKGAKFIYTLVFFAAVLLVLIFAVPIAGSNLESKYQIVSNLSNIEQIGILLFTKYLIVFELAALMLLVSMICAIVLLHKNMQEGL